jgi:hypothetical protein
LSGSPIELIAQQREAETADQPDEKRAGGDEQARRSTLGSRRHGTGDDAGIGVADALLLADLLGAVEEGGVDRAVGFRFALEFAQPHHRLVGVCRRILERLEVALERFLVGAGAVVVAERGAGDARHFLVDQPPALFDLRGRRLRGRMPRTDDGGGVRLGLLRLRVLAAQRGDSRRLDHLGDRVRFGMVLLQPLDVLVARAPLGGGAPRTS